MSKKSFPAIVFIFAAFLLIVEAASAGTKSNEVATSSAKKNEVLLDPTRPLGYAKKASENALKLQAIYFGAGRKEAVINGKLMGVGDTIHGKKIVSIKANKVIYDASGVRRSLTLRPSIFK